MVNGTAFPIDGASVTALIGMQRDWCIVAKCTA
jgi:hypothetical protein